MQAVIRELNEELGAVAGEKDVIFIGAVTEAFTDHSEVIFLHFWHDKSGTITGCYEGEAVYFRDVDEALARFKIMDYAAWLLHKCRVMGLLK